MNTTTCPGTCGCRTPLLADLTPEQIERGWRRICQTLDSQPQDPQTPEVMKRLKRAIDEPETFMDTIEGEISHDTRPWVQQISRYLTRCDGKSCQKGVVGQEFDTGVWQCESCGAMGQEPIRTLTYADLTDAQLIELHKLLHNTDPVENDAIVEGRSDVCVAVSGKYYETNFNPLTGKYQLYDASHNVTHPAPFAFVDACRAMGLKY